MIALLEKYPNIEVVYIVEFDNFATVQSNCICGEFIISFLQSRGEFSLYSMQPPCIYLYFAELCRRIQHLISFVQQASANSS